MDNARLGKWRLAASPVLLLLVVAVLAGPCPGASQNHDYIWYYGWCNGSAVPDCAGGRVDFSTNPPQAAPQRRPINIKLYGHIMADSLGEEVFYYSHGRRIFNRLDAIMENGDTINPGYWWHLSNPGPYASPLSGLSVSYPDRHAEYLYFHQRYDSLRAFPVCCVFARDIYFSHIDMAGDKAARWLKTKGKMYEVKAAP